MHEEILSRILELEAGENEAQREYALLHASSIFKCHRQTILKELWHDLKTSGNTVSLSSHLTVELKDKLGICTQPLDIFKAGELYDTGIKELYHLGAIKYPEETGIVSVFSDVRFQSVIPASGHPDDISEAMEFLMEPDLVVLLINKETELPEIHVIEVKSVANLFQYKIKGPGLAHAAQSTSYYHGLIAMFERWKEEEREPDDPRLSTIYRAWRDGALVRLVLFYVSRVDFKRLFIEMNPLPLWPIRRWMLHQQDFTRTIHEATIINTDTLPPAQPEESWECKWKKGQCTFYHICYP